MIEPSKKILLETLVRLGKGIISALENYLKANQ